MDQLLWSPDGTRLAIGAHLQVWIAELDPSLPVSQRWGRRIPGNDLIGRELEKLNEAIAADPEYPENYLERAVAHMSCGRDQEARADLDRFADLVTADDHHVGYEFFWWLKQCGANGLPRQAALLTPYAEDLMDRFPADVSSYQGLVEEIIEQNEREGRADRAKQWGARLRVLEAEPQRTLTGEKSP